MTKRSQCSRCGTGDGVHCRYYEVNPESWTQLKGSK